MKKSKKVPQRKFPYQVEYAPNPQVVQIHARSRFPSNNDMENLRWRYAKAERAKRHPLYVALTRIQGLTTASDDGYMLQLERASLFTWDKLLPKVLKAIQKTVAGKRVLVPMGPPRRPSAAELEILRSQGCSV